MMDEYLRDENEQLKLKNTKLEEELANKQRALVDFAHDLDQTRDAVHALQEEMMWEQDNNEIYLSNLRGELDTLQRALRMYERAICHISATGERKFYNVKNSQGIPMFPLEMIDGSLKEVRGSVPNEELV